jgi:hypothetical protein
MDEMVEMAAIGGVAASIYYMLWLNLVPISTTPEGAQDGRDGRVGRDWGHAAGMHYM